MGDTIPFVGKRAHFEAKMARFEAKNGSEARSAGIFKIGGTPPAWNYSLRIIGDNDVISHATDDDT